MFTHAAGLLVVFAAYAAYAQDAVAKTHYEDDLSHSNEQRIKNVAAVSDTIKWNVPMTTLATMGHQEDNAVKFMYLNKTIYPEAEEQTSKLMTEDVNGGCAVLVTDVSY
ncbi:hypothetical protein MTO96_044531 [Rhipicephalus appendiculatus]